MANKVDIMFTEPWRREVYRESCMLWARERGVMWIDECSACQNINIDETFFALAEEIHETQMKLVKSGEVKIESLKLREVDTSRNYGSRCCY